MCPGIHTQASTSVLAREPLRGGRRRVGVVVGARLAVGVLRVQGPAPLVLWQQLLDLPVVHARSDGELEILLRDGVPVLARC